MQSGTDLKSKLQFTGRHLLGEILRQELALDDETGTAFEQHPDARVEAARDAVQGAVEPPPADPLALAFRFAGLGVGFGGVQSAGGGAAARCQRGDAGTVAAQQSSDLTTLAELAAAAAHHWEGATDAGHQVELLAAAESGWKTR